MFKAKPTIPPGKILLQIERLRDQNKEKASKIKIGDSEISVFSPIRVDRGNFDFSTYLNEGEEDEDNMQNQYLHSQSHQQSLERFQKRKQSDRYRPIPSKVATSNKDISEVIEEQKSSLQKSLELIHIMSSKDNSQIDSMDIARQSRDSLKSPVMRQFTLKRASPRKGRF